MQRNPIYRIIISNRVAFVNASTAKVFTRRRDRESTVPEEKKLYFSLFATVA